jgi:plasmid stabilization system protein ParE
MAYVVNITLRAEPDLEVLYQQIHAADSEAARKWYMGLKKQILSLEEQPNRCAVTPERRNLRHLLYGRGHGVYRVIYRVVERRKVVEVLHLRHGSRKRFRADDLR